MIKKLSQGNRINYDITKWLVEDVEELKTLPVSSMGSTAFVIHTADTYMLDSKRTWYCITSDQVPVECDCVEELTIWNTLPEN